MLTDDLAESVMVGDLVCAYGRVLHNVVEQAGGVHDGTYVWEMTLIFREYYSPHSLPATDLQSPSSLNFSQYRSRPLFSLHGHHLLPFQILRTLILYTRKEVMRNSFAQYLSVVLLLCHF